MSNGKGKGKPTETANVASNEPNGAWVAHSHHLFELVVSSNHEEPDANDWLT